jgi:hypothetical protein
VSGGLQHVEDDGPAPCRFCGQPAAGPCARCHALVCGDCCTLTTSTAKVWAICVACDRQGGGTLRSQWLGVAGWLGGVLLVLLLAVLALGLLGSR